MVQENSRRSFIRQLGLGTAGFLAMEGARKTVSGQDTRSGIHLACAEYPWTVFYRREKKDFRSTLDAGLAKIAASGFDGFEAPVETIGELDRIGPLLEKHSLEMRSLYVNSVLHDADRIDESIDQVLAIAEKAKTLGTRLIVTNPEPIRWSGPENKDDAQLEVQAAALNRLGAELKRSGQILTYHNHDIELREGARELHHMMVGTDPDLVTFCMDAHWIYRGAGNSSVALFDILKLYGSRTTELHIRQSVNGIWSESFGEGDINYPRLVSGFRATGNRPHLVLEQAIEAASPHTMDAFEAHGKSVEAARRVFAPMTD